MTTSAVVSNPLPCAATRRTRTVALPIYERAGVRSCPKVGRRLRFAAQNRAP